MLPRLHLARNLLTDDGVIFVSIGDDEQANLKLLIDQVFGENNFLMSCKTSGVDGLIIVDLPYPENKIFANKCKKKSINFKFLKIIP